MKKYMKNKNFISESFYNKRKKRDEGRENKLIIALIMINLSFFPYSCEYIINSFNEKYEDTKALDESYYSYLEEKKLNNSKINDIKVWIRNIMNNNIQEAEITNENGEISVANIEDLNTINLNEELKVKNLREENNTYKLKVELK